MVFANTKDAARYRWLRENGLANEKRESRAVLPRSGKKASMAFRYWTTPEELDMTIDAMLGAAPSINEGVRKVTRGFRWESEAQQHIPTIVIEFEPVSSEAPNDAKGWQDRDRLAAMLTPEAKP